MTTASQQCPHCKRTKNSAAFEFGEAVCSPCRRQLPPDVVLSYNPHRKALRLPMTRIAEPFCSAPGAAQ